MKNKQEIEKLTHQTLTSIDGVQPVEANDFLYAKVVNRIRTKEIQERTASRGLMLKLSLALALFIGVNGVSFYALEKYYHKGKKTTKNGVAAFAEEYSLKSNSYSY